MTISFSMLHLSKFSISMELILCLAVLSELGMVTIFKNSIQVITHFSYILLGALLKLIQWPNFNNQLWS